MIKRMYIMGLVLSLIVAAACSAAGEAGRLPETTKTITVGEFGYAFEVPEACFEGPLPADCKQVPPDERPEECLCFVDTTNPQMVTIQKFNFAVEETSLASISILSPDAPAFFPGEDIELIPFLEQEWSEMALEGLPEKPNLDLDGMPAVSLLVPQNQGGAGAQEVFFIKNGRLFRITLVDNLDENNSELYEEFLSTFMIDE